MNTHTNFWFRFKNIYNSIFPFNKQKKKRKSAFFSRLNLRINMSCNISCRYLSSGQESKINIIHLMCKLLFVLDLFVFLFKNKQKPKRWTVVMYKEKEKKRKLATRLSNKVIDFDYLTVCLFVCLFLCFIQRNPVKLGHRTCSKTGSEKRKRKIQLWSCKIK